MTERRATDDNDLRSLGDEDTAIVYADGLDWHYRTLHAQHGVEFFGSEEAVREHRPCAEECGIVELEIKVRRWVKPTDWDRMLRDVPDVHQKSPK